MPSVYDSENFQGRVNLAAQYIAQRRSSTRSFTTCFEMYDGDAVAVALYRRARKRPGSPLARNFSAYLADTVEGLAEENSHRTNLAAWARELRAQGEAESRAFLERIGRERTARDVPCQAEMSFDCTPMRHRAQSPNA